MAEMVRMKSLKKFTHPQTGKFIRPQDEYEIDSNIAREQEALGQAVPVAQKADARKADAPAANKAAATGPLSSRGGATGMVKPQRLSRVARAPAKRTSKRSKGGRGF